MLFTETAIAGAWIVDVERHGDARGYFARTFDAEQFAARELRHRFPQCSVSHNARRGTLRGMHYQASPHEEAKLVRCTAGAVFDVLVDLRPLSNTYRGWIGVELTAESGRALYVPEGVAHGFQTLADASDVFYMISSSYEPSASRGYRWDDPAFGIVWPDVEERIMAQRDIAFAPFSGAPL